MLGTPLCRINLIDLFEGFFMETCEGMLSLNNDEIRPEVACATPLGGKDYTCCIAGKLRQA